MTAIEEFSDDELISELSKRFDSFIMSGRKILTEGDNPQVERKRYWVGDYDVCVGMLFGAALDCLHKNWGVKDSDIKHDMDY